MVAMVDNRRNHAGNNANGRLDEQLRLFVAEEAAIGNETIHVQRGVDPILLVQSLDGSFQVWLKRHW